MLSLDPSRLLSSLREFNAATKVPTAPNIVLCRSLNKLGPDNQVVWSDHGAEVIPEPLIYTKLTNFSQA